MNAQRFNVYVACNAIKPGVRARTKDAIATVRHVFVEADQDGPQVLARISARADLPPPSYVIESSPNRVHVLWRVTGFTTTAVEWLQKHLAHELVTDPAATPCSQTTRLAGYRNHKRDPSSLVTIEYGQSQVRYTPRDFPVPPEPPRPQLRPLGVGGDSLDVLQRARRYLARVEPAIAGQHGDLHTFKVCCRIVRGFALSEQQALSVLSEWNDRCSPPWAERELRDKVSRAQKYGREPVGGLR
jgi:hypothetical protein